ncbi:hypothetical protein BKA65DRAFT_233285 [Rhexocercosporidium sp. MPI-PUGE-AT-0058]|nr:hypothetical protein BKA65DRAFT_233285 [Rhexocercosporidium sp. MPI-PUGE-AT-0058]
MRAWRRWLPQNFAIPLPHPDANLIKGMNKRKKRERRLLPRSLSDELVPPSQSQSQSHILQLPHVRASECPAANCLSVCQVSSLSITQVTQARLPSPHAHAHAPSMPMPGHAASMHALKQGRQGAQRATECRAWKGEGVSQPRWACQGLPGLDWARACLSCSWSPIRHKRVQTVRSSSCFLGDFSRMCCVLPSTSPSARQPVSCEGGVAQSIPCCRLLTLDFWPSSILYLTKIRNVILIHVLCSAQLSSAFVKTTFV